MKKIKKMSLKHKQIARHLLMGESQRKVAKEYGVSESHLSRIKHSTVFIQYISDLECEAQHGALDAFGHLQAHGLEAAKALTAILKSPDSSNREKLKAIKEILRLGGYDRPLPPPQIYKRDTFEQRLRETFGDFEGDDGVEIDDMSDDAERH
jgi:hypothetical protein